jgi:hypothetical protein
MAFKVLELHVRHLVQKYLTLVEGYFCLPASDHVKQWVNAKASPRSNECSVIKQRVFHWR